MTMNTPGRARPRPEAPPRRRDRHPRDDTSGAVAVDPGKESETWRQRVRLPLRATGPRRRPGRVVRARAAPRSPSASASRPRAVCRAPRPRRGSRRVGPNKFTETAVEPRWRAFVRQYRDPMQIVLLVAGHRQHLSAEGARHRPRPALPDAVQRRARPAPGGQGGRRGRRAAEDDDHQGARAPRRRARADPGRAARPRRHRRRSRPATSCPPTGGCCRRRRSRSPSRR